MRARASTRSSTWSSSRAPRRCSRSCPARRRASGLHRFTGELPYRGDLMTHRIQYNPHLHVSLLYAVLVEAAIARPGRRAAAQSAGRGDRRRRVSTARRLSRQRRRDRADAHRWSAAGDASPADPVMLLNPNASDLLPLRKWESAKFVDLGRQHADRVSALAPGGDRRAGRASCRRAAVPRSIRRASVSAAGRTSLRELLTLYTLANVLVTNDSGPAHFASLTPVHTVVLFGPETPLLFGSRSPATTIIWKQLACSPCVSVFNHRLSPCRNNVCMQSITVDEVFDAVRRHVAVARHDRGRRSGHRRRRHGARISAGAGPARRFGLPFSSAKPRPGAPPARTTAA